MSDVQLQAQRRTPGRSIARAMRRERMVPGIFYFHGEEPIPIATHELSLRPLIYTTESHIVRLSVDGGAERTCVLKDIVFDPLSDRPTHFDLQGVATDEEIRVEVPVTVVGRAVGQVNGGVLDTPVHKLEVSCLPAHLPEHIEVDVTALDVNQSIHVSDLNIENVRILAPADLTLVSVTLPRGEETGASGITEPEVITRKKDEA